MCNVATIRIKNKNLFTNNFSLSVFHVNQISTDKVDSILLRNMSGDYLQFINPAQLSILAKRATLCKKEQRDYNLVPRS
jgi:hypothetical protein